MKINKKKWPLLTIGMFTTEKKLFTKCLVMRRNQIDFNLAIITNRCREIIPLNQCPGCRG